MQAPEMAPGSAGNSGASVGSGGLRERAGRRASSCLQLVRLGRLHGVSGSMYSESGCAGTADSSFAVAWVGGQLSAAPSPPLKLGASASLGTILPNSARPGRALLALPASKGAPTARRTATMRALLLGLCALLLLACGCGAQDAAVVSPGAGWGGAGHRRQLQSSAQPLPSAAPRPARC